jgi:REP element-mobilizing transposase RayT
MAEIEYVREHSPSFHPACPLGFHYALAPAYSLAVTSGGLEEIMRNVCADLGCELREFNDQANDVYLLSGLSAENRAARASELAQGPVRPANAAGVPRPAPLLASETPWSGSYFVESVRSAPCLLRQQIEQQKRRTRSGLRLAAFIASPKAGA